MKTLFVLLRGKPLNLFSLRIWSAYFLASWVYITLFGLIALALNAYYPLRNINLTTVDYFLRDRLIDRHLSSYLLGVQLIFHGYVFGLFLLFFKDMKRWNWLLPIHSKMQILSLIMTFIMLSAGLMLGVIFFIHQRIHLVLPFLMMQNIPYLFYIVFSYLTIWSLFDIKGVYIYFGTVSLTLLYPVMNPSVMTTIYQYLGLFSQTLELKISSIQGISMIMLGLFSSYFRIYKRALYHT